MSVSLGIYWSSGEFEEIPIASLRQCTAWGDDARDLGLELVPHFASFLPVESGNLDQLIREVTVFRDAMATRGSGYSERVRVADQLLDAFRRLQRSERWKASIG